MNFNLNFANQPEYNMQESLIDELISRYGICVKLLITEKINVDDSVFGDFSHMKTNSDSIFSIFAMPEEGSEFETEGYDFSSPFGGSANYDNISLFVSKKSLSIDPFLDNGAVDFRMLLNQLIIFPSNKIMEITDCEHMVKGVNNLFTSAASKSVYKLKCIPYASKLVQELDTRDIAAPVTVDEFAVEFGGYAPDADLGITLLTANDTYTDINGENPRPVLTLDGSAFDIETYPRLYKFLNSDTLKTKLAPEGTPYTYYKIVADLEIVEYVDTELGELILTANDTYTDINGNNERSLLVLDGTLFDERIYPNLFAFLRKNRLAISTAPAGSPYSHYKIKADLLNVGYVETVEDERLPLPDENVYETLDDYLDELGNIKEAQDEHALEVQEFGDIDFIEFKFDDDEDSKSNVPLVEKNEDIWGGF